MRSKASKPAPAVTVDEAAAAADLVDGDGAETIYTLPIEPEPERELTGMVSAFCNALASLGVKTSRDMRSKYRAAFLRVVADE